MDAFLKEEVDFEMPDGVRSDNASAGIFTSAIRRDVDKKMKKKEDDADEY